MRSLLAAVVQLCSGTDPAENREQAGQLIEQAASRGASLVALPEFFTCLGPPETIVAAAEPLDGPTSRFLASTARRLGITLIGGSFPEQTGHPGRIRNCSLTYGPEGTRLACYRTIHLFDVDLPGGVTFCESSFVDAGDEIVLAHTPAGPIGLATCYDLRFPELFRRLTADGAELLAVPSAFARATGRDHWEVLLRARAIENQAFVLAPGQWGRHGSTLETFGRSMIVDPWGLVLASAGDGPGIAVAELNFERLAQIRRELPALASRRPLDSFTGKTSADTAPPQTSADR